MSNIQTDKILSSVKAKLAALTNQQKRVSLVWRPNRNEETLVRIVPYKHSIDPFNELYFHYDLGETKSVLCPQMSIGGDEKCPICEFSQSLLNEEKNDKNYLLYKRLKPKLRVYVPVVVRGKESDGVKFWGVGKNTYTTIARFFVDPGYGDLSDPISGRDIKVTAIAPTPQNIYGQVNVLPAADRSRLTDNAQIAKSLIQDCPSVFDAFQKPSFDDLKEILEKFLSTTDGTVSPTTQSSSTDSESTEDDDSGLDDIDKMLADLTAQKNN